MKNFLLPLYFVVLINVCSYGQEAEKTMEEQANEAYQDGNYKLAINNYQLLLQKEQRAWRLPRLKYRLVQCHTQYNNTEEAISILEELAVSDEIDYSILMLDTTLTRLRQRLRFIKLTNELKEDSVLYVSDIVHRIVNTKDSVITYEDKIIEGKWEYDFVAPYGKYDSLIDETYFDVKLIFNNCTLINTSGLHVKSLEIYNDNGNKGVFIKGLYVKEVFSGTFNYQGNCENCTLIIGVSRFGSLTLKSDTKMTLFELMRVSIGNKYSNKFNTSRIIVDAGKFNIENSFFSNVNSITNINTRSNQFLFKHNDVDNILNMDKVIASDYFNFTDNRIQGKIVISKTLFSEFTNEIDWNEIKGNTLAICDDIAGRWNVETGELCQGCFRYFGVDSINIDKKIYLDSLGYSFYEKWAHNNLINSYYKLYNIYKDRGDLMSANGCYAEMKDVMGAHLKGSYEREGGFRNYVNWKLNRLLKVYTNHGTDTSLPIVISIYVMLAFSVFYFFFPSEWDITSKAKLVGNFKTFVAKNEHGYFKPLMILIAGFIVSLVNAITLSVNSFVTLGFGTIPTTGLARYVCIIQGFIGWFLLSIFTVTLINQVLF